MPAARVGSNNNKAPVPQTQTYGPAGAIQGDITSTTLYKGMLVAKSRKVL